MCIRDSPELARAAVPGPALGLRSLPARRGERPGYLRARSRAFRDRTRPVHADRRVGRPGVQVARREQGDRAPPAELVLEQQNRIIHSRAMRTAVLACCLFALVQAAPAHAQLENITTREAASALKAALEKGSTAAVARLGRTDGFFGDPRVKIALPESMQRTENLMRRFGLGRYADEVILGMNRAAEAAVPEAKQLFVDSVRKMTLQDAKGILQGGETAGTEYFRRTTEGQLRKRFLPVVQRSTEKVGLVQQYDDYAEKAA